MKRSERIRLLIFASSAVLYFPFSEWMATARVGTMLFLWGQVFYLFPLLAAIFATPALIVCLVFQRTRRRASFLLLLTLLLVPSCIGGIVLGHKIRMAGMRDLTERSKPLVNAIRKYEREHSSPPRSLDDLVPHYVPAVPSTGMMAYPDYQYYTGDEAESRYAGNRWVLSVETPSGGINFDRMLYFPNQDYPDQGYGGGLEPVDGWAYVHE